MDRVLMDVPPNGYFHAKARALGLTDTEAVLFEMGAMAEDRVVSIVEKAFVCLMNTEPQGSC